MQPHVKKIVDDTERRLNILFDQMNNDTVSKPSIDQLNEICQGGSDRFNTHLELTSVALGRRDVNGALNLHVNLVTNSTGDMSAWVVSDCLKLDRGADIASAGNQAIDQVGSIDTGQGNDTARITRIYA